MTDLLDIFSVIWIILRSFSYQSKMYNISILLSFYWKNTNMKQNLQNKAKKESIFGQITSSISAKLMLRSAACMI